MGTEKKARIAIALHKPIHVPHIYYDKRAGRWGVVRCVGGMRYTRGQALQLNRQAADFVLYKNKELHQYPPRQEHLI